MQVSLVISARPPPGVDRVHPRAPALTADVVVFHHPPLAAELRDGRAAAALSAEGAGASDGDDGGDGYGTGAAGGGVGGFHRSCRSCPSLGATLGPAAPPC